MIQLKSIEPLIKRTEEQNRQLRHLAKNKGLPELIYEDFYTFVKYNVPTIRLGKKHYPLFWVHEEICGNYQQAIFGNGTLLTVEIGPQIGKSIITSLFICYVHGLSPETSIIYATYNENKAIQFTKTYLYNFMSSEKYKLVFPYIGLKFELDKKDNSRDRQIQSKTSTMKDTEYSLLNLKTKEKYKGGYRCFGIDQGIHGIPADIFIVDDYVDKGDSVRSEGFRIKRKEWFYNDLSSRLQDNSSIIIAICTRWYFDDIIGLFHKSYEQDIVPDCIEANIQPPKLNKVRIRAEYRTSDDNSLLDPRTYNGEKLWVAHTLKYAIAKKGIYYNAMYNCDPTDTDSIRQLKESDFGYYSELPKNSNGRYIFSIDGASTANKKSDHTAIGYWYVVGFERYLVKLWYLKLETPAMVRFVFNILEENKYDECLIEHASSGIPLCQHLKEHNYKHTPLGFNGYEINDATKKNNIDKISKSNSKMDRYLRVLPEFLTLNKRIFLPETPIEHQEEYLKQMTTFDNSPSKDDDFVDMTTYFIFYTQKNVIKVNFNRPIHQPYKNNLHKPSVMCYNTPSKSNIMQYFKVK